MYYNYMEYFSNIILSENFPKYYTYHDNLFIKKWKMKQEKNCHLEIQIDVIAVCKNENQEMVNRR